MDENCHEYIPEDKELEKLDLQTKIFREQNQAPREHGALEVKEAAAQARQARVRFRQAQERAFKEANGGMRKPPKKIQNLLIWSADQHEHINTALVETNELLSMSFGRIPLSSLTKTKLSTSTSMQTNILPSSKLYTTNL